VTPVSEVVVGSAQPEHLEQLLQLVYLRLTTPRKDNDAITAWRTQAVSTKWSALDDPETAFGAKFDDKFPHDVIPNVTKAYQVIAFPN